jgi:hypothetical protein
VEELQPFACKELITPNPHVVVQARCLELATIGVAVGASLVNYRAGTPSYTSHLKVQPGFFIVPWITARVKHKSLAELRSGFPLFTELPEMPRALIFSGTADEPLPAAQAR